jgi:hypothetical protein
VNFVTPPIATLSPQTTVGTALRHPQARELLESELPELRDSAMKMIFSGHSLGLVVATSPAFSGNQERIDALWKKLTTLSPMTDVQREAEPYRAPTADFEADHVPRSSARSHFDADIPMYGRFELVLYGPSHGNPFVDVALGATIETPSGSVDVPGFYDDAGVYRLRYLPLERGEHQFSTRSNARSLDGISGVFHVGVAESHEHGPVRVERTFHFSHADGTRYLPVGTTAYAWTHQGDALEEQTLATLASSPFNKIRMCVFPKSYLFNENEPSLFPFVGTIDDGFDVQRFNVSYWHHLEERVGQLAERGVQADIILFHPYDRWGFSVMDATADDRYLRYAVARLASFSNVWWSLANEYDLMPAKSVDDWERFASIVRHDDPADHLLSIHNCFDFYDYSRPWVTHASVQRRDVYKTAEMTTEWRELWRKPVVIDECAYEGDIDQGWGNITGEEMVRRFWEGAVRGGYVGHGETYLRPDEILWWSKGGQLHGSSPARIAFLRRILEEAPRELEPMAIDWDTPSAGVEGQYYLFYYGFNQPRFRRFLWDPTVAYTVDVIDTWNMTIERLPGVRRGRFTVDLPARPYIALRFQVVHNADAE